MSESNRSTCPTEQSYYDLWSSRGLDNAAPTVVAEQGGRLADRAAWVFVGAYQGAMRQCFGELRQRAGWASYLVSEARGESRAPTCTLQQGSKGLVLRGTKSWVAARPHLATLVVNAPLDSGETTDVLVPVDTAGVALLEKRSGRFLPELAVGEAHFDEVVLPTGSVLAAADTHAALFGLIEARCLLVALAGHFNEIVPAADEPAQALLLAGGLTTSQLGRQGSIEILLEAMTMLADWFAGWVDAAGTGGPTAVDPQLRQVCLRWADDRRLLQMHRPILEKHLQAYTGG